MFVSSLLVLSLSICFVLSIRLAGDTEAVILSQEELREMEPALSHEALGAVFCPREAVVEPWLVPMGYAESARLHGKLY